MDLNGNRPTLNRLEKEQFEEKSTGGCKAGTNR